MAAVKARKSYSGAFFDAEALHPCFFAEQSHYDGLQVGISVKTIEPGDETNNCKVDHSRRLRF